MRLSSIAALLGALVTLAFLSLFSVSLHNGYQQAVTEAERFTRDLAALLEKHATHTFDTVNLALANVAARQAALTASPVEAHPFTDNPPALAQDIQALVITDASGAVSARYSRPPTTFSDAAGRTVTRALRESTAKPVYLASYPQPATPARPALLIGRRLTRADGRFAGAALALLEPDYLYHHYQLIDGARHIGVALFHRDGSLLARYPPVTLAPAWQAPPGTVQGTFKGIDPIDQQPCIISYRANATWPVLVTVSIPLSEALSEWHHSLICDGIFVAALTTAMVLFIMLLVRQLRQRERLQTRLRQHLDLQRALLDAMPNPVFYKDMHGRYLGCNAAFEAVIGVDHAAVVGKTIHELVPADFAKAYVAAEQRLLAHADRQSHEHTVPFADGSQRHVLFSTAVFTGADAEPAGIVGAFTDITDRKRAEDSLRKLSRAVEQSPATVVITDTTGAIEYVNPKFVETTGYTAAEAIGKNPRLLKSGEMPASAYQDLWDTITAGREWHGEFHNERKNGELYWESASISPIRNRSGQITHFVAVKEDISERKRAEEQLRIAATVFDTAAEAIMVTDAENKIKAVNAAFCRITGYSEAQALGQDPKILQSGRHDAAFYRALWHRLLSTGHWEGEIWNRRHNGEIYPQWLSIAALRDEQGRLLECVAVFSDITQRKRHEERIHHQANYDTLTELPNRSLFLDRLKHAIAGARREPQMFGLLFIDLDHFKAVNDTLGHHVGDRLLQQTAARLQGCVRATDTVARLGGDEFTVILQPIRQAEDAIRVATQVLDRLTQPFKLDDQTVFVSASIGITIYPTDARTADALLRNADMAMYRAKEEGRNTYHVFTTAMNAQALARLTLANDLRLALERGELYLCYQPIIDLHTRQVSGAEALVRWRHPQRGLVAPQTFIPLAEDKGLIGPLGEWVLWTACEQARNWQSFFPNGFSLSLNVSRRQLKRGFSPAAIEQALTATGLTPAQLTIEITERLILEDSTESTQWLQAIKAMGVQVAIDDFGTGYSSLSYLKRLPVDIVKIDHTFVHRVTDNFGDAALVEAIIAMAHSLNLVVVAEGVETPVQLAFLQKRQCAYAQGAYFCEPLPYKDFEPFVQRFNAHAGSLTPRAANPAG